MSKTEQLVKQYRKVGPSFEKESSELLYQEAKKLVDWILDQFERMINEGTQEKRIYLHHAFDYDTQQEYFWYVDPNTREYHGYDVKYYRPGFNEALLRAVHDEKGLSIMPIDGFFSISIDL